MPKTLPTSPLGSSGLEITRVGFGSWAIGGGDWVSSWGPQDDGDSIAAIRHAVESGVNWIDTAAVYGLGHSEEVVAKALEVYSDADRPFVFTKGGLIWNVENRRASSARIGEASSVRKGVEDSLRRLGTEQIDLYFMHWPTTDGTKVEEYWQTFLELKAEGKLRAIGLSNHDSDLLDRAEALGHVDAVQPQFSAISTAANEGVLPWCVTHNSGAVVYSPMGSGLLTGHFSADRVASLAEDDWRGKSPAFTTDLDKNLAIAEAMARVASKYGVTTAAVAVSWVLGFAGVSGAIVGARTPLQVDGWTGAANLTLTAEDYAAISSVVPSGS